MSSAVAPAGTGIPAGDELAAGEGPRGADRWRGVDRSPGIDWWRRAVIYEVYIRSFADGNGDGLGDIPGLVSRLPYLAALGVDAIWVTPWYPSPMHDAGYDVVDHCQIDPRFGTLADAEQLVSEAHALGLRVLLDLVPNHTSSEHRWFRDALEGPAGSPARERYVFRGTDSDKAPNDWESDFGGAAWTRTTATGGGRGEWYLHLFDRQQPDLNWRHPEVGAEFEAILRFWFARGVDGFRIDVAPALAKDPALPDLGSAFTARGRLAGGDHGDRDHPYWDRDEVHAIYRGWRALADSYSPPRVFVAEAWLDSGERLARYVRPGELHTAFNFDFLASPWSAPSLRTIIDRTLATHEAVGAPATWVLSNHDVARVVSRFARDQGDQPVRVLAELRGRPADLATGRRRARAAALLMMALPGGAYIYQGDELGLAEVEDLPDEARRDPIFERSGRRDPGRDGCRVPMPWEGVAPPFGFSPSGTLAPPWLPQPPGWADQSVDAQSGDPGSMLELYRRALSIRRDHPALGDGSLRWLSVAPGALAFERAPGFACTVNVSAPHLALPADAEIVLSSQPLGRSGAVPPDTTVWLSTPPEPALSGTRR